MFYFDQVQIALFQFSFLLGNNLMRDSHGAQVDAPHFQANHGAIRVIGQPQPLNSVLAHEFAERAILGTADLGSEQCIAVTAGFGVHEATVA